MSDPMRLVALRVPTGWSVCWNGLFEDDDDPSCAPSEDLLWLAAIDVATGARTGVFVDLGWYGSRVEGTFRMSMLDGDWDHELARFESRERAAVIATLERWLTHPPASRCGKNAPIAEE